MLYVPHLCISITHDEYSEQPNDTKRCNKISDLQLGGNPSFEIMISFGSSREFKTPKAVALKELKSTVKPQESL